MGEFKSIYPQQNRLYLDWDIHYKCNFNCEYCFQKYYNNLGKNIPRIEKNIDVFLKLLKKHPLNFTLGLLGGEPTLNKNYYFKILNYFEKEILPNKTSSEIYVSTNLSQTLEFYKNHKIYNNVYQWVSIHPEYHVTDKNFFKKIELLMIKSPQQFILSPMLVSNPSLEIIEFYEKVYLFYKNNLKEFPNLIYSPQIIFTDANFIKNNLDTLTEYPTTLINTSIKEFIYNEEKITLNEFLKNKISFKNKKCSYNYYNISPDLFLNGDCTNTQLDLKKDFVKFLKLKPKEIICQQNWCVDYPKMLSKKMS